MIPLLPGGRGLSLELLFQRRVAVEKDPPRGFIYCRHRHEAGNDDEEEEEEARRTPQRAESAERSTHFQPDIVFFLDLSMTSVRFF